MTPHDNLVNQTCIPENDGYLFNTFQKNFETGESTAQTKMAKANTKFHHWRYSIVEGRMSVKPVADGKNCLYQN